MRLATAQSMASSKLMSSSRNSDLSRRPSSKSSPSSSSSSSAVAHQTLNTITTNYSNSGGNQLGSMTIEGLFRDDDASSLLDAQIALMDTAGMDINLSNAPPPRPKTVDEVWQEIVSGGSHQQQRECKEEIPDEMMTLEDFLARAGAVEEEDIKDLHLMPQPETDRLNGGGGGLFGFDHIALSPFQSTDKVEGGFVNGGVVPEVAVSGGGGGGGGGARGRGKRGRAVLEPLDKAAQQRQRRMIKNRESAARSRERKQAYQVELESLAVKLEEEKERLLKEKAERAEERLKQLMEHVIPIVEKRRPSRVLRRFRSLEW